MTAVSPFVAHGEEAGSSLGEVQAKNAAEQPSPFVGFDAGETEDLDFGTEADQFDFGAAEDEAAHPILSVFHVPAAVVEALSGGLPSMGVALAVAAGLRDVDRLTNLVFYFRHPDRIGRKIERHERDLAAEWISIRDRIVRPALQSAPAPPAPSGGAGPAATPDALSSSRLQWPGASPEELAFMRAVYERHAALSKERGAGFVFDLPESALGRVAGHKARRDAAQAAQTLLDEAQAALQREGLADRVKIGIVSAYRPATRQFEIWQGRTLDGKDTGGGFPYYYRQAIRLGKVRSGDFGHEAVDTVARYLGGYVASPGYSNHQDGLAFDFGTGEVGKRGLKAIGWKSWFRKWLEANGRRLHFQPLATEAWHWTYHPPTQSEVWAGELSTTGVRSGRVEVPRVPLLASHRGGPPDLILRWNDMPSMPEEVDVVVHLHGFWYPGLSLKRDIEPVSGLDLTPAEGAAGQGRTRPTVTVLPRGHYTGIKQRHGSYYAYTFPALVRKEGLDELVRFSLGRFGEEIGGAAPRVARVILTAHSGGGKALLDILRHHDPHQVHVFDALYWNPTSLAEWARRRIRQDRAGIAGSGGAARDYMTTRGGALRVFYQDRYKGGTRPFSLSLRDALAPELDAGIADWYRVEASRYDHFQIPRRYGWRVLADASASVPDAYVEPAARHEAELDEVAFETSDEDSPAAEWLATDPEGELLLGAGEAADEWPLR